MLLKIGFDAIALGGRAAYWLITGRPMPGGNSNSGGVPGGGRATGDWPADPPEAGAWTAGEPV